MIYMDYSDNYQEEFFKCLNEIMENGKEVSPRGELTKEIRHATICINPYQSLFVDPIRNLNFSFLFAENLWYLSGRNSLYMISSYNKNYHNFADDGILQGSYGPQILEQLRYIIDCLKKDKDSRQAVITLWRPNPRDAKDKPCTLTFHFMIREDKLDLDVTMRSNDVIWGQNYDAPSFSLLLICIAGILGIEAGKLYLTANSLHLYEKHFELAKKLIDNEKYYKEKYNLIYCNVGSLEEHMKSVEKCLFVHYQLEIGTKVGYQYYGTLPDNVDNFYKQHIGAMAYYKAKQENHKFNMEYCIEYLGKAKSPLSIIFQDDYQNYLLKFKS